MKSGMPYIIFVPLDGVPGSMHLIILVCYACFCIGNMHF